MEPLANSAARAMSAASLRTLLSLCGEVQDSGPEGISVTSRAPHDGAFFAATVPTLAADPDEVLDQARRVATRTGRPQHVWADAGSPLAVACWQQRLEHAIPLAVMSREGLAPVADPGTRQVVDADDVVDFRAVHRAQFAASDDPDAVLDHFAAADLLLSDDIAAVVRHEDDVPVAAGYLLRSHHVHGIFWVATVPEARGQGHGLAVTTALLGLAGPDENVVLQATPAGRPVYQRAGFTTHGLVDRWIVRPTGDIEP